MKTWGILSGQLRRYVLLACLTSAALWACSSQASPQAETPAETGAALSPTTASSPVETPAAGTGPYKLLRKWDSGDGRPFTPSGIAVDGSGNVYVADTGSNRILKFSPEGAVLAKWGAEGSGDGQFKSPQRIAVDSAGNLYVADYGNNRIQKFDSTGTFLAKWGGEGSGDG